ncbi:MAG: hypothetical protein ACFFBL_06665 [Promethearchaeota archaeon]
MTNDVATHLQALYHSGQIIRYIHSKMTNGPLKTGWIEQGLLSKGMKGKLRDKINQESLLIPADRFARLARDHSGWEIAAFVLLGSKGLLSNKFVAMVFGQQDSQTLIAFEIQKTSPQEIVRFLLQNVLGLKTSVNFEEPTLDYVEQLRMEAYEGEVDEMTVFSLPKKKVKMSEWIKDALLSPSSESIQTQHGSTNKIPKFAALITRWLTSLELFKGTLNGIAALVFLGGKVMDACFWDQPQRIAAFTSFKHTNVEALSMNYLTPLWIVPGESVEKPPHREVIVEPRTITMKAKKPSPDEKPISSSQKVLIDLTRRLDSLETALKSSATEPESSGMDRGSLDVLQSRLSENIKRIELLSRRLVDLEKRLKRIQS